MSVDQYAALLGVIEIVTGVLIAIRPVWLLGSAIGGGLAAGMFLTTLTFLITTPGWEPSLGGFPVLPGPVGQFLIEDVVLLGAARYTAGEALEAARGGRPRRTGLSQMIFAEGGGLTIPFGTRLRMVRPPALAFFVGAVGRSKEGLRLPGSVRAGRRYKED
jgi:hypothetical protein